MLIVPAWIIMYFGGYWLIGHEGLDESTPGWAEAGIHLAEIAAALTIILLILGWLARRRPRLGPWLAGVAVLYALALASPGSSCQGSLTSREPPDSASSPIR